MFPLQVPKELPDKTVVPNAVQHNQEVVSEHTMSVIVHSQEPAVALTPHMPMPVSPPLVYSHHRSSQEPEFWLRWKPPDTGEDMKWHACHAVSDTPQPSAMKHSPPNGMHPIPLLTDPTHEECLRRPNKEPAHRVLEGPKPPKAAINLCQGAGQEVIGEEDSRILLHPLCSAAAFTMHMSMLVDLTPAHSLPYPSMELEFQCRKPPDCRGEGWLAYNAINEKVQTSVIKHSPLHGTVLILSNTPPACQGWAETHYLLNTELAWHARSKPPDRLDEI